jgi:hypothetical protein
MTEIWLGGKIPYDILNTGSIFQGFKIPYDSFPEPNFKTHVLIKYMQWVFIEFLQIWDCTKKLTRQNMGIKQFAFISY